MQPTRMSPFTALFIGMFLLGAVSVVGLTAVVLRVINVADQNIDRVIGFAGETIGQVPEILENAPPAIAQFIGTRQSGYVKNVQVAVNLLADRRREGVRPTLSITNNGDETITLMSIRVAALNPQGIPVGEWTEVVATPVGVSDDWRGPLGPNQTRHVVMRGGYRVDDASSIATTTYEIVDIYTPSCGNDTIITQ